MQQSDQMTPEQFSQATAPQRAAINLIDASRMLAEVMRYRGDFRQSAEYLRRQDSSGQPYPVTYVFTSNVVIDFLTALADAEDIRAQGLTALEKSMTQALGQKPSYGPRRRDVE